MNFRSVAVSLKFLAGIEKISFVLLWIQKGYKLVLNMANEQDDWTDMESDVMTM